jgi:Raf kinase inhibitor-like YbhB/YbcL family protein
MAEPNSPHLTTHSSGGTLVIERVHPNERGAIPLRSNGVEADGRLADLHSAYYDDVSPELSWTARLEADAYALIVEDPDAPMETPFVHWVIWNIPGTAKGLPQGLGRDLPSALRGAVQGKNSAGKVGYMGARPPPGHGVHRYHFELFALDSHLPADPDLPFGELVNMLRAHTLATGELVATYERRESPDAPENDRDATTYR